MKSYRLASLIFCFTAALTNPNYAAILGFYDFEGEVLTPSSVDPGLTFSNFAYDGPGTLQFFAGNGSADAAASNSWTTGGKFEFTVDVASGSKLALGNISFAHRSSGTGPTDAEVLVNGMTIGDFDSFASGVFNLEVASDTLPMDYTGTLTVEILATGATSSGGTWRVDDVTVNGTVLAIPEPRSVSLLLAFLATLIWAVSFRR